MTEPQTLAAWTEYRSAVVYLDPDGAEDGIRETGPTRRTRAEAEADAEDDVPTLLRDDTEPRIARAIVTRRREEPPPWRVHFLEAARFPDGQA